MGYLLLLQIGACLFILMAILAVWLIFHDKNTQLYYYKNYKALDSLLGMFAYRHKYKYNHDTQYYSKIMEYMKKYLNIDYYFTAHELQGRNQDFGNFSIFLVRTSNSSFFNYNKCSNKFRLSDNYFKKNFSGLVMSYQYIAGFASEFVLFASKESLYYDIKGDLEYPLLANCYRYNEMADNIWVFNANRCKSKDFKKFLNDFSYLYNKTLAGDCTILIIYENCHLNIFLTDDYLIDAKKIETHLQVESAKIDEINNFFRNNVNSHFTNQKIYTKINNNAYLEIRRNSFTKDKESSKNKIKAKNKINSNTAIVKYDNNDNVIVKLKTQSKSKKNENIDQAKQQDFVGENNSQLQIDKKLDNNITIHKSSEVKINKRSRKKIRETIKNAKHVAK